VKETVKLDALGNGLKSSSFQLKLNLTRSYSKNPNEMALKEVSKIVLEEPLNFSRDHINSNKKDLPPRDILPK
jgi:ribosomal protein S15P/S13E